MLVMLMVSMDGVRHHPWTLHTICPHGKDIPWCQAPPKENDQKG
ncbi:hypothetical protein [Bacillus sp. sid0103]|nr:hypothetical protein [Bacillus sp. sid0103]